MCIYTEKQPFYTYNSQIMPKDEKPCGLTQPLLKWRVKKTTTLATKSNIKKLEGSYPGRGDTDEACVFSFGNV